MVAGVIRLGAYGEEDRYLTYKPQITFFKAVYRRHTYFSMEPIEQNFIARPDFGGRYTSILSPHGDLIMGLTLIVTLPPILPLPPHSFRWVDRVGAALIDKIEFEVNGEVIDTITGDWIVVQQELVGYRRRPGSLGSHAIGFEKMIGGMEPFTGMVEGRTIHLPIPFWFSRTSGQAFPVGAINLHDVRVNVEFKPVDSILQYGPTHSMVIEQSRVYFVPGCYIAQGTTAKGIYFSFEASTRTLYFNPVYGTFKVARLDATTLAAPATSLIMCEQNGTFCTAAGPPTPLTTTLYAMKNRLHMISATILTQYAYLGSEERDYFRSSRHDYIIEQMQTYTISNIQPKQTVRLLIRRPCSELVWVAVLDNSSIACGYPFHFGIDPTDPFEGARYTGGGILAESTLLMNSAILYNDNDGGRLQAFMHHPPVQRRRSGIHTYSFALFPDEAQPSGTVNMTHIERVYLDVVLNKKKLPPSETVSLKVFARSFNVLTIEKGKGRTQF